MKHITLLALAAIISTAVSAQDIDQKDVPSVVLNAFQTKFSNASGVDWEREGELFQAEFEVDRWDHDVWLDASGNITKHKSEVEKSELPSVIADKLKSEYKDYTIEDVEKIESDGKVYFEVDLDGKSSDRDVLFLSDGTVQEGTKQ